MADEGSPAAVAKRPSPVGAAVLEVSDLTAGYGDAPAVRGLNLRLVRGEIVALFGPNGAGKTTALLSCIGAINPMGGSITWMGAARRLPLHKLAQSGVGFVREQRSVITNLSVRDNLRLGRGGVDPAMDMFPELQQHLGRPAGLLSGGQQQILVLARALAAQPKALLVDELSLGLAPQIVDRLLSAIAAAAKETGLAVLLVEQQASRAFSVADRWYLLNNGALTAEGHAADGIATLEAAYLSGLHGQADVTPATQD